MNNNLSCLIAIGIILSVATMTSAQQPGTFVIPTASITIDGDISDWTNIDPAYVDDVNDENPDADFEGTDLNELYLAKDEEFLYILMTLFDGAPKTDLITNYIFEAAQHPTEAHTPGDRSVTAAYNLDGNSEWHADVGERLYPDGSGRGIAEYPPSFVGVGANFIEFKARLSDLGDLNERYVGTHIHPHGGSDPPYPPVSDYNSTGIQILDGPEVEVVKEFVTRFYQHVLDRDPDPAGLSAWVNELWDGTKAGADVAQSFIFSPEFVSQNKSNEEYVTILYKAFFNREADQAGWDGWLAELEKGTGRDEVLNGFIYAPEFKKLCADYGIIPDFTQVRDFVGRFYQQCLGREADAVGLSGWVEELLNGSKTGADVAWGFVFSPEFIERNTNNDDYLRILYKAFFDREADPAGWETWLGELNGGRDRGDVLNGFIYAQEFYELCENHGIIAF